MCCICNPSCNMPEHAQPQRSNNNSAAPDESVSLFVSIQYQRNDVDFSRGKFRVRGDTVEIFPAYEEDTAIRVDFFGDEVEGISEIDALRGTVIRRLNRTAIFPASH